MPDGSDLGHAARADDSSAGVPTGVDDAGAATNGGGSPPEEPRRFRLGNRPALTGLRAPVIIAILIFHSNFKSLPGAWASVQVFFVLSGFLITSMLAGEGQRNGRIALKAFYARRAARLLPPLLLTCALLAIYGGIANVADASQRLWGDILAAMFYYADYRQAFHPPFFGFLAQTWSLSIEEQFYVLWSVLMVLAVATHRRRLAYGFAVAGIVASIADRMWVVLSAPHFTNDIFNRAYYPFDTRADGLFVGCLLGLLAADGYLLVWKPAAIRLLTAGALASVGVLAWQYLYQPLQTGGLTVWGLPAATVAAAVIIAYFLMCPRGLGSRLMGVGALVFIGDLSYTLYLVHFPVYLAVGTPWSYWPSMLLKLAIIFAIAVPSWFFIERPLMQWRRRSAAR